MIWSKPGWGNQVGTTARAKLKPEATKYTSICEGKIIWKTDKQSQSCSDKQGAPYAYTDRRGKYEFKTFDLAVGGKIEATE